FHVGAGSGADNKLKVELDLTIDVTGNAGIFFGIDDDGDPGTQAANVNLDDLNLTTADGADAAIRALDLAIDAVSSVRSELGAKQNRLEHTIANLSVAVENLSASESRIRDTDMAEEMV